MSTHCRIRTFSGREVNPLNLQPSDICVEDIMHALSLVNRFAGHTSYPISVAQHSVYVSRWAVDENPERLQWDMEERQVIALQGLMHDATEAYLGDVTKWLKGTSAMSAYREAEDRAWKVIAGVFDLPVEIHPAVEEGDRVMVRFEGTAGLGSDFRIDHPNYPPLSDHEILRVGRWSFWDWRRAKEMFFTRYRCIENGII